MNSMDDQKSFTLLRKRPNVLWWIGGLFMVLVMVFLYQLFGPSPKIVVSPQTTVITGPLEADGLPNYEAYQLAQMREGVTPQNNAAALLWPAIWPGELSPTDWAAVAAELGLDEVPDPKKALVPTYMAILEEMRRRAPSPEDENADSYIPENLADDLHDQVMARPWKAQMYPWLAQWVKDSQQPLDMIVAGSRRSRCYFPSPSLHYKETSPLVSVILSGQQSSRECGRSLATRAMLHLGEGRHAEAWNDLLAIHRVGRLVAQGQFLVEDLIGIALDNIASEGTMALLASDQLSAEQARQIERDLRALPYFTDFADSLDNSERLSFANAIVEFKRGRMSDENFGFFGNNSGLGNFRHLKSFNINWNAVLVQGNEFYDRYVKAARLPTFEARQTAYAQLDAEIRRLTQIDVSRTVGSLLNPSVRSDAVASVWLGLFLPALQAVDSAQNRVNTKLDLLRLAAALAVYRAEQGDYPQKLDELVPGVVEKLPVDLYHAKPFVYTKTKDGYLLYTLGENGIDEGGSHEKDNVLEGHTADEMEGTAAEAAKQKIPAGADDLSIRVPRLVAKPIVLPPEPIAIPAAPNVPDTR
ncbi:MAG: hypothetical protein IT425_09230 [Pirellulales bacterium]|nr:hypothetical protein [Pirellulales bacterium]